jgi:hypothetical protein
MTDPDIPLQQSTYAHTSIMVMWGSNVFFFPVATRYARRTQAHVVDLVVRCHLACSPRLVLPLEKSSIGSRGDGRLLFGC